VPATVIAPVAPGSRYSDAIAPPNPLLKLSWSSVAGAVGVFDGPLVVSPHTKPTTIESDAVIVFETDHAVVVPVAPEGVPSRNPLLAFSAPGIHIASAIPTVPLAESVNVIVLPSHPAVEPVETTASPATCLSMLQVCPPVSTTVERVTAPDQANATESRPRPEPVGLVVRASVFVAAFVATLTPALTGVPMAI
jgi:hypothetical protein